MWQVTVDKDVCTGCGEWVEVCMVELLERIYDKSEPSMPTSAWVGKAVWTSAKTELLVEDAQKIIPPPIRCSYAHA